MRRWTALASVLVFTSACSYIFDLPASELTTGVDASADALADVNVADVVTDAPHVAHDAATVVPFCASRTSPSLYCADFDAVPAPDLASVGSVSATGGVIVLSSAVSDSPPRSLLASVVRKTNATASVTHALGAAPGGLTLSFDMLVSASDADGAALSAIELVSASDTCTVRLASSGGAWAVTQVCAAHGTESARATSTSPSALVKGRWQHFALSVALSPTKRVTLDVDGARVVATDGVAPLAGDAASIALGLTLVPSGSFTLFQDNVLATSP